MSSELAEKIIERMKRARIVEEFLIQMLAHPDEAIREAASKLLGAAVQRGAAEARRDAEAFKRNVELGRLGDLETVKTEGSA